MHLPLLSRTPTTAPCPSLLAARQAFEWRLGHFLARDERALAATREMLAACSRYLDARVVGAASGRAARAKARIRLLSSIMRPVALPFAGRPLSLRGCHAFLQGEGNLRELQGTVWLFLAHLVAEDLVGPNAHPDVDSYLAAANFSRVETDRWVAKAMAYKSRARGAPASRAELDPMFDMALKKWHPVRILQQDTRERYSPLHEQKRHWSLLTRTDFEAEGGALSPTEKQSFSPIGRHFVPWGDASRFFRPNGQNVLIASLRAQDLPLRTGVSGVAMHIMHFGRLLQVQDSMGLKLATAGYLLSIHAHSFAEIILGMRDPREPDFSDARIAYTDLAGVDWQAAMRSCGRIP